MLTTKSIIDRVIKLDKSIVKTNKIYLIVICRDKEHGWIIKEYHTKDKKTANVKEFYYNDYKEYLDKIKLD